MSNSYLLDPLVTGDSLQSELRTRSKEYYETSVSLKKLPIHEAQGWYVLRQNKNNIRIRLDKPTYELVEDELWSLYARLGFTELNKNREFNIKCGNATTRKIDIFAKDDETVIISECTSAELPGTKKSLTYLIDKIKSYREDVIKATHNHYGKKFRPKFGWVIATRNIVWTTPDLERADEADITVIKDQELDYYAQLQKHLKTAARYQFLANLFPEKTIKELDLKVPATKGKMGGTNFYTFLISPEQLLKIAYIGHKNSKGQDALETYQRMLKPRRLKEIADYINDGGRFPTNIVVNLQYKRNLSKKNLSFSKKDEIGELCFGELILPNCYATAWIIDGQHRLYGYALSDRSKDSVVPVLAFVNLDATAQKNLFVDINNKQVKVPRGLLLDLYSELHWGSNDPTEAITSLSSKVTKVLGSEIDSPLKRRILIGEQQKTNFTCLTITTLATALIKEQLIGTPNLSDGILVSGPIGDPDLKKALNRSTKFLSLYLSSFKAALPIQWELGDAKGGYICTNNSIAALLKVLKAIFDVLERIESIDVKSQSPEDLMIEVSRYSKHLIDWLTNLSDDKFTSLRSKVGSKGQIAVAWEMQQSIYDKNNNFKPKGLQKWMESFDKIGTTEAKELIDEIQLSMLTFTLSELKKLHGEELKHWWYEGIPHAVRTKCVTRKEEERGKLEAYQYLDLLDYKTIAAASSNWSKIYQSYFSLGDQQGDKNKKLNWILQLNDIRKTVSHPERGLLTKEQVDFVKDLHGKLKNNLGEHWIK
ncbi:MAG: DGQHR domain-containing protein [Endozoicomonadaceae bacterium]|nr:DGQHR domain-containing protein [Endozoicomonadaceae bacterium]